MFEKLIFIVTGLLMAFMFIFYIIVLLLRRKEIHKVHVIFRKGYLINIMFNIIIIIAITVLYIYSLINNMLRMWLFVLLLYNLSIFINSAVKDIKNYKELSGDSLIILFINIIIISLLLYSFFGATRFVKSLVQGFGVYSFWQIWGGLALYGALVFVCKYCLFRFVGKGREGWPRFIAIKLSWLVQGLLLTALVYYALNLAFSSKDATPITASINSTVFFLASVGILATIIIVDSLPPNRNLGGIVEEFLITAIFIPFINLYFSRPLLPKIYPDTIFIIAYCTVAMIIVLFLLRAYGLVINSFSKHFTDRGLILIDLGVYPALAHSGVILSVSMYASLALQNV